MKRIIKKNYDNVQLSPQKKQAMLTDILENKRTARKVHLSTWKVAAVIGVAAAIVLAIVLPLTLGNRSAGGTGAANDQIVMQTTPSPTAAQVVSVETKNYVSAIVLSLNPEVEIRLDEEGVVTEVVGLNEDGVTLVEGIEFAGLSLQNATIMVVNQLILQEYITAAQIQNEINISLESDSMTLDTLSVMTDIIKTAADGHNIAVDVIADEDAGALQIVLEGQGSPEVMPDLEPADDETVSIGLELEFVMAERFTSAHVDNVYIHPEDGETIDYLLDFVDATLGKAALMGVIELIDKGYITDADDASATVFTFTGSCRASDMQSVAKLAALLIAEYDLKLAVRVDQDGKKIVITYDETVEHTRYETEYTLANLLNRKVNKDEEDLSPRQQEILKTAYSYREYYRLFEKRYYIVLPDFVGMTEEQATGLLREMGLYFSISRSKVPGYDPTLENAGLAPYVDIDAKNATMEEIREWEETVMWDHPVVDFGCVFHQDGSANSMHGIEANVSISVIMPESYDGPEVISENRKKSGFVLRDLDIPFYVSPYPNTFLLSEADSGFEPLIEDMDRMHTIENAADYTVVIEHDLGWEGVAVITITHESGFPQSRFFLQNGLVFETEYLWRRDVPANE